MYVLRYCGLETIDPSMLPLAARPTSDKGSGLEQICAGTGGPCTYTGRDMKTAHAGMGVRNRDFNALVQDLGKSLNKFKVPKAEQKEIASVLLPMRKDIVTR